MALTTVYSVCAQEFGIIDIRPTGSSHPAFFTEYNGKLYFSANDQNGREIWVSDGTQAGTQILKIINPNGDSHPGEYTISNDKLYFRAMGSMNNFELWVSDGTPGGTNLVKDIYPGTEGSYPEYLTAYDGKLYFGADDGVNDFELWVSDGTLAGTHILKDIHTTGGSYPGNFIEYNGKLYFNARNDTDGYEVWVTDGTIGGTQMLKDIHPTLSSDPKGFTVYGGKLYFSAYEPVKGRELWVTDGTETGTLMLKDISSDWGNSNPENFTVFNGKLYFSADNGINGKELWVTDGTTVGTQMLVDLIPYTINGIIASSNPHNFTEYDGKLYFGILGKALYATDGTAAGTQEVKMINTTNGLQAIPNSIDNLIVFNGKLYFRANDGTNGGELWESDGTEAGTKKIMPAVSTESNPLGASSPHFTIFQNELYFTANYNSNGSEIWKLTDNTVHVAEVNSGSFSLYPNPTEDAFTIISDEILKEVKIIDLSGKTLYLQNPNSQQADINIADLPEAMYIVKVTTNSRVRSLKIIKD